MQRRAVRLTLLALLLGTGLGAVYTTWVAYRSITAVLDDERDVDALLDRMSAAVAALGAAQQAYVAPGQQRGDALTRATALVQQIYDDITALRSRARSSGAGAALLAFGEGADGVVKVDDRARELLRDGQELMAADVIYTEARQGIEAMALQLRDLQTAERNLARTEQRALSTRAAGIVGTIALLWLAGVLALTRAPDVRSEITVEAAPAADLPSPAPAAPPVDLSAAAGVCADLTRVSTGTDLPPILARAAGLLDAEGLIVWLGAGEELFPATAHGYSQKVLSRLQPIPRGADNATAAAWRRAELCSVSSDEAATGAIVAPMFGPAGCFGVLAAEVRAGRERDSSVRAVASILAAQLSSVVSPWPAPSVVEEPVPSAVEETASNEGEGPGHESVLDAPSRAATA